MDHKKMLIAQFVMTLVGLVLVLAFWGAVAWVAWHFISKFW